MRKKTLLPLTPCLVLLLAMSIGANAGGTPAEDRVKADWSVNATHNLASSPPSLDAVQDFYDRATGDEEPLVKVCEFHFADLRNSGNLSLIVTANSGSRSLECDLTQIFDRTPTGFEVYLSGASGQDLANSILDLNHDRRHELLLWANLARYSKWSHFHYGLGCGAEWPLIFAWNGNTYADVSDQYKDYYPAYLKSVNARLAAYSSVSAPAAAQTANPAPEIGSTRIAGHFAVLSPDAGGEGPGLEGGPIRVTPAPTPGGAATPAWAALNQAQLNYPCTAFEAAKTEAFLGTRSDSTMSAAIKNSESDDPDKRIAAASFFPSSGPRKRSRI